MIPRRGIVISYFLRVENFVENLADFTSPLEEVVGRRGEENQPLWDS